MRARKEILPKWIRFFSWIYLMLYLAPVVFLVGLTGIAEVSFTIFGLSYSGYTSLHPTAIIITVIATLSATVAYAILWGKDWAIKLGLLYAWIGLATCGIAFFLSLQTETQYIPLEPILLIPFLVTLNKKKKEWLEWGAIPQREIDGEQNSARMAN